MGHWAEAFRIKGRRLLLQGNLVGAEANFRTALDVAQTQQAKS